MSSRRTSRHRAVQVLYQCDMRELDPDQAIAAFYGSLYSEENEEQLASDSFMEALVRGSMQKKSEIDERISKY
ncbi:MAG TPA: transcription antitermination factor NusB, partial [Bryobacteraceae bacterium]|nr:transcription antitermination factor NusB [Bryobacteraceae bacterium]